MTPKVQLQQRWNEEVDEDSESKNIQAIKILTTFGLKVGDPKLDQDSWEK